MSGFLLEMDNITKKFPGVTALKDVNFNVRKGEIHAIVGENGAGKSTLMKVLSGIYPHGDYEGKIIYNGKECKFKTIKDSEKKGISIIHQELALVPYMSIGENMFLGNERGYKFAIDWNETYGQAAKYLNMVGLNESPHTLIKDIGVGKQQLVEIAKALAKKIKLLVLDEPTASLNETDSKKLLDLLLQFKKEGLTSIIISHKLNEVMFIADRITILRDGSTVETIEKNSNGFSEARIVKGMIGRELTDRFPKRVSKIGEICLDVRDWTVYHPVYQDKKVVDNVSLNAKRGEIVGIAGLMGAGRTELAMSIFGKSYGVKIRGTMKINGKKVNFKDENQAISKKLVYITEDRKGNGLILSNPIYINTTLAKLKKVSRFGTINKDLELKLANEYKEKLNTRCTSVEQEVGNLSGGNQQKVLVSKWLFADPEILILDEPTRGIDVGAKYEIYCIMNEIVESGKSIIMISSELPEILGMSDRIYVMNEGRIIDEMSRNEASQEAIMTKIVQFSNTKLNLN